MTLGDMLQHHAGQAAVATTIITEAVMTQLRGPPRDGLDPYPLD